MISVSEAKHLIHENVRTLAPVMLPLAQAARHVLAADVFAAQDIPAFAQSSMDGYALRFTDRDRPLAVRGESAAGSAPVLTMGEGEAMRIFTGAPLPSGSDTVVMQEKVTVKNGFITIGDPSLQMGSHVRDIGAEVKKGALAMDAGTLVSPAATGFLAGIGIADVSVYPTPTVYVVVTGPELQVPGAPLKGGQVYESNSFSLRAALELEGVTRVVVAQVSDDLPALTTALKKALSNADLVLVTGGVSVGDYDLVPAAANACGVHTVFHKVKQRPGKPLFFGMRENKPFFGLPGNPSSVLSCFYNYVVPALNDLCHKPPPPLPLRVVLRAPVIKVRGLTHFLKGRYEGGRAIPLGAQESFRLTSFATANCLICLPEQEEVFDIGAMVDIYLLPGTV